MWHPIQNIVHFLHITVQSCYVSSYKEHCTLIHITVQSCYVTSYKEHCALSPYYCTIMLCDILYRTLYTYPYYCTIMLCDILYRTLCTFSILLYNHVMCHPIQNIVHFLHITVQSCYVSSYTEHCALSPYYCTIMLCDILYRTLYTYPYYCTIMLCDILYRTLCTFSVLLYNHVKWHPIQNIVHVLHITVQSCYVTSYTEHCARSPYYCTIMLSDILYRTLCTFSVLLYNHVMWHPIQNIVHVLLITVQSCYVTSYTEHSELSPYYCTIMLWDIIYRTLCAVSILLYNNVWHHKKNILHVLHITAQTCYMI